MQLDVKRLFTFIKPDSFSTALPACSHHVSTMRFYGIIQLVSRSAYARCTFLTSAVCSCALSVCNRNAGNG
jgi:hypothetical protein